MLADIQKQTLSKIVQALIFINVFIIPLVLRTREVGDSSVDFQIILKLMVWAVTLGTCLWFYRLWIKDIFKIDNIFWIIIIALIIISCFYAPNIKYAAGATFSVVSVYILFYLARVTLEEKQILGAIISAIALLSFLSILLYFINPEMARFWVWENGKYVVGSRLEGLTTNPNAMGYTAAVSIIFSFFYIKLYYDKSEKLILICTLINLIALLMSHSRTSAMGLIIVLVMVYFFTFSYKRLLTLFTLGFLLILTMLIIDMDIIFSMLSRSGDASEITSVTGRTHIWATVIDLILQKPMFGWGYTAAGFILPTMSDEIGYPAYTCHNMMLQLVFSLGFVGCFFFIIAMSIKLYFSFKYNDHLKIASFAFILLTGLTEASIFDSVAEISTLFFATAMALHYKSRT